MPQTYRSLVESFRDRILARDEEAVLLLINEYGGVMSRLNETLEKLIAKIEELKRAGKIVSEYDIYREIRYIQFIRQLSEEMQDYAKFVVESVSEAQFAAIDIALEQADRTLRFVYKDVPEEVYNSFTRFDEFSARNIVAKLTNEQYLKGLVAKYEPTAALALKNILIDGVIRGESPRKVASELVNKLDFMRYNAETIARTEINSAYREGNLERYRAASVVKGWEWSATLDLRTCPVCIAMDGKQFPLDVPFATHPNCRCSPLPITFTFEELGLGYLGLENPKPPDLGKRGEEWFRGLSATKQEKILGNAKFDLFSSGQIKLDDLVEEYTHFLYGKSRQERSIKSLKQLRIVE